MSDRADRREEARRDAIAATAADHRRATGNRISQSAAEERVRKAVLKADIQRTEK